MAVKIQVKDGFDTNTNCCGLGVAPLTNAYQNIPMLNNTFSGYNNSVQNWPVSAHRTLGDLGVWNTTSFAPALETRGAHLMARTSLGATQLNEVIANISMIDPVLATSIASISRRCVATGLRIARIASFDLELARNIVRVAEIDLIAAASLSDLAIVNPVAARLQLQHVEAVEFGQIPSRIAPNVFATVKDEGDVYRIVARVPGATAETIDVTVRNGKLIIKAKSETLASNSLQSVWRQEFAIGQDVSIDAIDATIINGTLNVLLPKAAVVRNMVGQRMQEVAVC